MQKLINIKIKRRSDAAANEKKAKNCEGRSYKKKNKY